MDKLKPCPFCGAEAEIIEHNFGELNSTYGVCCKWCGANTRQVFYTKKEATEAWNRRAKK